MATKTPKENSCAFLKAGLARGGRWLGGGAAAPHAVNKAHTAAARAPRTTGCRCCEPAGDVAALLPDHQAVEGGWEAGIGLPGSAGHGHHHRSQYIIVECTRGR